MGSRLLPFYPLLALLLFAPGCAEVKQSPYARPGEFLLTEYLPEPEEIPEGIALRDHSANKIGGAPVAYPEGSVERLASEEGWAIFTRVAEREHAGKADWLEARDFPIQRLVVYVYRRRPHGIRGELEMAAWVRHANAKRFEIFGSPGAVVVLVNDGPADQVVDSSFDRMAAWFQARVHGPRFRDK